MSCKLQIAALLRLGRESLSPSDIPPAGGESSSWGRMPTGGNGIQVKLWKAPGHFLTGTTCHKAELMRIGPLGVSKCDEVPYNDCEGDSNGDDESAQGEQAVKGGSKGRKAANEKPKKKPATLMTSKLDANDFQVSFVVSYELTGSGTV